MAIPATQMRPGMIIKHNDVLHSVFAVEHRTPGNLRAFIQAKLRNLKSGAMFEHRFRSGDAIDRVIGAYMSRASATSRPAAQATVVTRLEKATLLLQASRFTGVLCLCPARQACLGWNGPGN